ncbi:glycosyltransferase [Fictibacillus sp. KU28468]|uniref:glycosyltransferase n=1 Tax=Fictibacillus sp. KU28468 TaxID=2991053 RepID=UPI00223CFC8C|nr:glycosyltransferase [Fictibacillus sp. KU28468]UZJ79344.1 glycosyltransferase [Fictibacillus sp. KU28468]
MVQNILFFDTSNQGHHFLYNKAVIKGLGKSGDINPFYYCPLQNVEQKAFHLNKTAIPKRIFKENSNLDRLFLLFSSLTWAKKNKISHIHLLYLDSLFLCFMILLPLLMILNIKITATLHWLPQRKSKQFILKSIVRLGLLKKIIVHGNYTKDRVIELIGYKNGNKVISIIYPNLHPEKRLDMILLEKFNRRLEGIKKPILLSFGGLRHDKGIDILLKSLSLVKGNFTLIVAGKEDYFSKEDIKNMINKYKLSDKVFTNIKFIPDEELPLYFNFTDIVVLPYRKYFSGQSGPLTEGVTRFKPIIGPNNGEIGYTIKNYKLGTTFEAENVIDLSYCITDTIRNLEVLKKEIKINQYNYQSFLTVESFVKSYKKSLLN